MREVGNCYKCAPLKVETVAWSSIWHRCIWLGVKNLNTIVWLKMVSLTLQDCYGFVQFTTMQINHLTYQYSTCTWINTDYSNWLIPKDTFLIDTIGLFLCHWFSLIFHKIRWHLYQCAATSLGLPTIIDSEWEYSLVYV